MNKSIAVIRHIGVEGLGTIEDVLKSKGLAHAYIDTWKDPLPADVSDYGALVILGGPMGVYEQDTYPFIKQELSLIRKARDLKLPVIGICLGSQMIAQALGGRVYKGGTKEIGWYDIRLTREASGDRLFGQVPGGDTFKVFQWHGDTYNIPQGAERLASSQACPNQAFIWNNQVLALQFHLEMNQESVANLMDANDELVEGTYVQSASQIKEYAFYMPTCQLLLEQLIEKFLAL